jgi:hypothetical protein
VLLRGSERQRWPKHRSISSVTASDGNSSCWRYGRRWGRQQAGKQAKEVTVIRAVFHGGVTVRTPEFGLVGIRMVIIGIPLRTWMRVIVDVDVWVRLLLRDLSRLYGMVITRPLAMCRRYIIPLFRRRPPGLHTPYKRKGKERKERKGCIKQSCRVRTHINSKVPLPIGTVR